MKISFVGGGVMAEAIIGGTSKPIWSRPRTSRWASRWETGASTFRQVRPSGLLGERRGPRRGGYSGDRRQASKPRGGDVRSQRRLGEEHRVVSIVAGARMATLTEGLQHPPVIRVMPNTPAQIGAGMSVWTAAPEVSEERTAATRDYPPHPGRRDLRPRREADRYGDGPERQRPRIRLPVHRGADRRGRVPGHGRDVARRLVLQTVLGSTKLVQDSGRHPAELKDMVTSPGGTTVEALLALEEGGVRASIINAVAAAYEKSQSLG